MLRPFILLLSLLLAANVWALDLNQAKATGLVGEQRNGYLGVLANDNDVAAQLVQRINHKRKKKYLEIADQQNTALANIERIAGEKLTARAAQENTPYQTPDGQWAQ